jgi:RNA polymerase sigma-70 factor (ECF subfamily)
VTRAQAGDRRALEELLARHQPRIYAVCRRMMPSEADAADASQDALIAVVRSLDRFDGRAAFSTWTYRIAVNACIDELRRRKRRPVLAPDASLPEPNATGPDHETLVADRELVTLALQQVPEPFRTAVVLRDVADLDYAEISAVLDVPVGTVRSRIARGRAELGRALGNQSTPSHRPTGQS